MIDAEASALVHGLAAIAADLGALVASPVERTHWVYLLVALALAALVWARGPRRRVSLRAFLFPRAIWLHRSALLDYRFVVVRVALGATLLAPLVLSSTALGISTLSLLTRALGPSPLGTASPALVVALLTVVTFVVEDLARYVVHRAFHRVPLLWELHQVHHSAEVLTPMTLHRTHPVEGVVNRAASSVAIGVSAGFAWWLCHRGGSAWEILGVHGASAVWTALGANLRHSHVWLSYGPVVERVLASPAQHQIHHSVDARHHGRNFASALALWDWLFGTLYVTRRRERLVFGLADGEANHAPRVLSMLVDPLRAAARRVMPRRAPAPRRADATARGDIAALAPHR